MIAWLVNHRATVILAVVCIVIFGATTYSSLPREASPDVKIPVVMVTVPYIGVSPSDIESLVTIPLENELSSVKDLKKMSSTSAEGVSIVMLEFVPEVIIQDVIQRVRDRVSRVKPDLPSDAEEPSIREISFSDFPILILTLGGPIDEEALKAIGERLEDDVGSIPGVLEAKLNGGREREMRVQVNPNRLHHYSLSMNDVIGAIASENVNIPGGNVSAGAANYLLRVPGDFESPKDIENVAIKRVGDRPVFVRDVATVLDSFEDRATYSRMNGAPSLSLAISKRTGANILEVADKAKMVAEQHKKDWPQGVTYSVLGDQSSNVQFMVTDLENNIITALILVVLVILFFMGVRNSLFIAVAIPMSMLLGMIVIWALGFTLNMVVLFSLILSLGMLVDNAIVLVENIYRHAEDGADLTTASIEGTREVAGAVIASTATTVGAFLPLVLWTGIMGQFMGFLPKTVIIVLVSSLVIAIGILPVFTAKLMKVSRKRRTTSGPGRGAVRSPIVRAYCAILQASIRHRYISAALVTMTLLGTFIAYGKLNHGVEFFPSTQPDAATVSVRAADGTDLEETDRIVRQIEVVLSTEENIHTYVAEVGVSGGGNPQQGAQAAANMARITLDFLPAATKAKVDEKVRIESTFDTIDRLRATLAEIVGAKITVDVQETGPPVGAKIGVEVSGDSFHEVGALAAKVRRDIANVEGTTDLRDDFRVGRPEMRLKIDRGAAKRVGASTQSVAGAVRAAVAGSKASTLRDGENEYDITVELAPQFKNDLQSILSLRIPGRIDTSPETFPVPLSAVASYELAGGSGAIHHIDQDLVVTINGDVLDGYNENEVRQQVGAYIEQAELPPGFSLRMGGADEEQKKASEFLTGAFQVAIFLIAIVLVTQFNSFAIPGIILFTVVLSLVGVLWGLILTGTPFGIIMTGLGVISLAGVVVNNAIVLLDYVQQLRREGLDMHDALVRAGLVRFRPVMLTAVTTVLGLVPMATGIALDFSVVSLSPLVGPKLVLGGQSADWWGPMAIAVIFGLAYATILTLVMVPTFYSIVEDLTQGYRRVSGRIRSVVAPKPAE